MRFRRFFCCFFIFVLFLANGLISIESELLKTQDISKIMQQIFAEHFDEKEMTSKILQHSFRVYIDQFDPDRLYLLQSEVDPFLNPSSEEMTHLMAQYKNNDFSAFEHLNAVIQQAIDRARTYRADLETQRPWLFQHSSKSSEISDPSWEDPNLKKTFAGTLPELNDRIKTNLLDFIASEKRRFGETHVMHNQGQALAMYERQMHNKEDSYLYTDAQEHLLPKPEQQNLFAMHVLKALANSLDAHTSFFNKEEAYDMKVRLEKGFQGIGIVLRQAPQGIIISKLIEGGPAAKSGLIRVQDRLLEIDGIPTTKLDFDQVMEKLHGENGSTVTLSVQRSTQDGDKTFTVKLKRAEIAVNSDRATFTYETFGNGIIGKITLHSFYQGDNGVTSENDVRQALEQLQKHGNLRGLILDLRENGGGFLSQAVKVAGLFISSGVVVISKYSNGEERFYRDMNGKVTYDGPLIILTSKATASAAEIVAQALQDYGVALIVGDEHTYGKGTIQSQTVTENAGGPYFKVTVGKYYTVSGKTPQGQGVKADVVVPSQFAHEHIGEEYLDYTMTNDRIPSAYDDKLKDIDPSLKSWYLHYYMPKLQHQKYVWRNILPNLQKNSTYRIDHNKNYQLFLHGDVKDEDAEEAAEGLSNNIPKNFGAEDLQMAETVNIMKDMILLQSHMNTSEFTENAPHLQEAISN